MINTELAHSSNIAGRDVTHLHCDNNNQTLLDLVKIRIAKQDAMLQAYSIALLKLARHVRPPVFEEVLHELEEKIENINDNLSQTGHIISRL